MDKESISNNLVATLDMIDRQIEEVRKVAEKQGVKLQELRNMDGEWWATPLVIARAQTLHAMAILLEKTKES